MVTQSQMLVPAVHDGGIPEENQDGLRMATLHPHYQSQDNRPAEAATLLTYLPPTRGRRAPLL
jgi:hypothetical protein